MVAYYSFNIAVEPMLQEIVLNNSNLGLNG
jgi:hypothetical protein